MTPLRQIEAIAHALKATGNEKEQMLGVALQIVVFAFLMGGETAASLCRILANFNRVAWASYRWAGNAANNQGAEDDCKNLMK